MPEDTGIPSEALFRAGQRLLVDQWTAELVTAFRDRGVRPILLKGPAVAGWLYRDDPTNRTYCDVDLLVSPTDFSQAKSILTQRGFLPESQGLEHAQAWVRPSDGAAADLHRCLHGMEELPAARVWETVTANTESLDVAGVTVEIPNEVVRTLHVALHVSAYDSEGSSPRVDVERAVVCVDRRTWRAAAELGKRLGIDGEMGARLRTVPQAVPLADELELPIRGAEPYYSRMALRRSAPAAYGIARLASLPGTAKARYVRAKFLPSAAWMRQRSRLARRGALGLFVAYVARIGGIVARCPRGLLGWINFKRASH